MSPFSCRIVDTSICLEISTKDVPMVETSATGAALLLGVVVVAVESPENDDLASSWLSPLLNDPFTKHILYTIIPPAAFGRVRMLSG